MTQLRDLLWVAAGIVLGRWTRKMRYLDGYEDGYTAAGLEVQG